MPLGKPSLGSDSITKGIKKHHSLVGLSLLVGLSGEGLIAAQSMNCERGSCHEYFGGRALMYAVSFNTVQWHSIKSPHLLQIEGFENKRHPGSGANRLGRRGAGFKSPPPTNGIKYGLVFSKAANQCSRFAAELAPRFKGSLIGQQVRCILLKSKVLKTDRFHGLPKPPVGLGGRGFKMHRPNHWNQADAAFLRRPQNRL